jgi:hypothetical protein
MAAPANRSARRAVSALVLAGLLGGVTAAGPASANTKDPKLSSTSTVTSAVVALSTSAGTPGQRLVVSGRHFRASTSGEVTVGGQRVATFVTTRDGSFEAPFTVPPVAPGTVTVTAKVRSLSASAPLTVTAPAPAPAPAPEPVAQDAVQRRVRADLKVFTDWLATHGAKGYIGEVGWPNQRPEDVDRWNAVADGWFRDATAAGLTTAVWATGEWWGTGYTNSVYVSSGGSIGAARPQAAVLERQQAARRGINVAGGEFGTPGGTDAVSSFSNRNPGTYDVQYHYDGQASFDYLARRGVTSVRLPFRWERIQPTLGGPLDSAELARLHEAVARAQAAGLTVVLDVHNYGAYYLFDGQRGVRRAIGSAEVTPAHFADLWRRLSASFKGSSAVVGYGLMNEPVDLPSVDGRTPAQVWEAVSQQAVDAIRANRDATEILVPGYLWSPTWRWSTVHPKPWVNDPSGNVRYEAHQYFDHDRSGVYVNTYDNELTRAAQAGF